MKRKSILIIISVILLLLAVAFVLNNVSNQTNAAFNQYKYVTPTGAPQGSLKYELNFDNIINKYSSNIIIGKVVSSEKYSENNNMYKVEVSESLLGQVENSTIYVHANKYSLLPDNKYMLFMRENDSSLQSNIFYTVLNEFVVQIDKNDSLLLLQDPEKQQFVKPFKDNGLNSLSNAKAYIDKNKKANIYANSTKKKVVNQAKDEKELISLSSHIIEITVLDCQLAGEANNIAIVGYDCYKKYKGGGFNNINRLLLPPEVETGKKYLVFLDGDNDSVAPTTRKGSVIEVGTEEYNAIVQYLK